MVTKYYIKKINDVELKTCPTCNGTGKIIGTLTSDSLDKPYENIEISCPTCNGDGKISTGKKLHYKVATVFFYGEAKVTDNGEEQEYNLGFVCDSEDDIKKYMEMNGITSFVKYPGALMFYAKDAEELYDSYEEAEKVMLKKEAEYKEESGLKLEK